MNGIYIDLVVTPILKEFIVCTNGSYILNVNRTDFIARKLKYLLQSPPPNYKYYINSKKSKNIIKVKLLQYHINGKLRKRECKNYLSNSGQVIMRDEINNYFKKIFHNYVAAYVRGSNFKHGSQKDGINDFCSIYKLTCDNMNYEMLKKSWSRSFEKKMIFKEKIN